MVTNNLWEVLLGPLKHNRDNHRTALRFSILRHQETRPISTKTLSRQIQVHTLTGKSTLEEIIKILFGLADWRNMSFTDPFLGRTSRLRRTRMVSRAATGIGMAGAPKGWILK